MARHEHYDENTMFKVYDSLRAAGLDETKARETISDMQNKGILFRERGPDTNGPVMRGGEVPSGKHGTDNHG